MAINENSFTNIPIPQGALPQFEQLQFTAPHPHYAKVLRWNRIIWLFLFLLSGSLVFYFEKDWRTWPLISTWCLGCGIWAYVHWKAHQLRLQFEGYAIREHDIVYRSGWWIRKSSIIPFSRLQHISVQAGPIERKYQLAHLRLYTAGSDMADIKISGLDEQLAENAKQWLSQQIPGRVTEVEKSLADESLS